MYDGRRRLNKNPLKWNVGAKSWKPFQTRKTKQTGFTKGLSPKRNHNSEKKTINCDLSTFNKVKIKKARE